MELTAAAANLEVTPQSAVNRQRRPLETSTPIGLTPEDRRSRSIGSAEEQSTYRHCPDRARYGENPSLLRRDWQQGPSLDPIYAAS